MGGDNGEVWGEHGGLQTFPRHDSVTSRRVHAGSGTEAWLFPIKWELRSNISLHKSFSFQTCASVSSSVWSIVHQNLKNDKLIVQTISNKPRLLAVVDIWIKYDLHQLIIVIMDNIQSPPQPPPGVNFLYDMHASNYIRKVSWHTQSKTMTEDTSLLFILVILVRLA